jgi:uracil-DNA glycosylase
MADNKILMETSWYNILKDEFQKNYMKDLQEFLRNEKRNNNVIYPPEESIFNAFCQTSFDNTKVVIIGQDPYHGPNQAHGLSFSVKRNVAQPPSLKNVFKELVEDVGITFPKTGYLLPWAKQGVLLLNATLTVRANQPRSHYGVGWEIFTDRVVELLAKKEESLVFLLWGKAAQEKCFKVLDIEKERKHLVLTAAHPSFYSVAGFFGCKHFSKTNDFLIKNKKTPIDWQIE